MTAQLDIHRAAHVITQQSGRKDEPLMAGRRCDALLELGDVEGLMVWKGVLRALEKLMRAKRGAAERVN